MTTHAATETGPLWSPDSAQIAFGSDRKSGVLDLYVKRVNGSSEAPLVESATDKTALDWSADGKWILYSETDPKTGRDLWAKSIGGEHKVIPVAVSAARENSGRFSPDGG